jgi:TRAP-type C4-dicarboxylate transport system permease small subunit
MKWTKALNDRISRIESVLLVAIVLFMITLSFLQVVLRNFFSGGITWADVCLRNLVLWVGFIGASLATKENRHITVDVVTKFVSPLFREIADLLASAVSVIIGFIFIYASARFVISEYEAETIAFLGIPFWVVQTIIPFGFSMITFRFVLKVIEDIEDLRIQLKGSR